MLAEQVRSQSRGTVWNGGNAVNAENDAWRGAALVWRQDMGYTNGQDMGDTMAKTWVTVMAKT